MYEWEKGDLGIPGSGWLPLMVVRAAWEGGVDYEDLADGFGAGNGTHGDWSGIRDSSMDAQVAMLERALNAMRFEKGGT